MNLCSRGRKEAGRRGGEGYRTRTLRRAYGGLQQPPSAFKNNTEPYTSRRGAGRRCLARMRPQRCGRGEAAGDCVNAARAFSTAAVDRAYRTYWVRRLQQPWSSTPARFDGESRTGLQDPE